MDQNADQQTITIDFSIPEKLAREIAREATERGFCSSVLVRAALESCPNIREHLGKPVMEGRMPPSLYKNIQHQGALVRKCYSMPQDLSNALRIAASTEKKSLVRCFSERMREYLAAPLVQDKYEIVLEDDEVEVEMPVHIQEGYLKWLSERDVDISQAINTIISGRREFESQMRVHEATEFLDAPEQQDSDPADCVVLSIKKSNLEWLKMKSPSAPSALSHVLETSRECEESFTL